MADTLYSRLGGYDGIAAVCDNLLPRLKGCSQLGRSRRIAAMTACGARSSS